MKNGLKKVAFAFGIASGVSALAAGPAAAELVAGWDFSNLSGDSAPVPAGFAANYTNQGGAGSLTVSGDVIASANRPGGSVKDDAGLQGGINGYRSTVDPSFPQGTTSYVGGEYLGLTARNAATLEFDASVPGALPGETWHLTLGATSLAQPSLIGADRVDIDISFGETCGSAAPIGTVTVDTTDTEIRAFLGTSSAAGGCVVLEVDGSNNQPLIDNVSISTVPEPGMGAMIVAGLAGLFGLARRRA